MTGFSLPPAPPLRAPGAASRPALTAPPAALTPAETDRIADAFPARPAVAHKLYGPGRQVQDPAALGARIDVSA